MKKCLILLPFVLITILITGCIEIVYEINIDENDTEIVTMKMGMPSMFAMYMDEIITELQNEGYYAKTDTVGDKFWIIGTKKMNEGSWEFPPIDPDAKLLNVTRYDFDVKNYIIYKKYFLNIEYDFRRDSSSSNYRSEEYDFSIPVKFIVNMPGKISETNAHEQENETVTWNYVLTKTGAVDMELITYKINYALIIPSVLLPILLIGVVAFVIVASKKSKPKMMHISKRPAAGVQRTPPPSSTFTETREDFGSSPQPTYLVQPVQSPRPTQPIQPTQTPRPAPPVQPVQTPGQSVVYVVTLFYPVDGEKALKGQKIIETFVRKLKLPQVEIVKRLKGQGLRINFKDRAAMEKNVSVFRNAGFRATVKERRG